MDGAIALVHSQVQEGGQAVSKEHLLNLLCRVYVQEISADEAFDELEDLIERIKRLEEAGGQLMMWLGGDISASNRQLLQDAWNKAKEAKP